MPRTENELRSRAAFREWRSGGDRHRMIEKRKIERYGDGCGMIEKKVIDSIWLERGGVCV